MACMGIFRPSYKKNLIWFLKKFNGSIKFVEYILIRSFWGGLSERQAYW